MVKGKIYPVTQDSCIKADENCDTTRFCGPWGMLAFHVCEERNKSFHRYVATGLDVILCSLNLSSAEQVL